MNRLFLAPLIALVAPLFLFSCGGKEPSVIKKWDVDHIFYREQEIELPMKGLGAYFHFKADSTFEEIGVEASDITGRWELDQEQNLIHLLDLTPPDEDIVHTYVIEKLTADTLVMVRKPDGQGNLRKEYLLVATEEEMQ